MNGALNGKAGPPLVAANTITLTAAELKAVTGYMRPSTQLVELHRQGFSRARRSRVTGEVILEREHYLAVCRGGTKPPGDEGRPKLVPPVMARVNGRMRIIAPNDLPRRPPPGCS